MEELTFSTFYFSLPSPIRLAIWLTFILLIARRPIILLIIRLVAYLLLVFKYVIIAITLVCTSFTGFYINFKLKRRITHFPIINKLEGIQVKILIRIDTVYKRFVGKYFQKGMFLWPRRKKVFVTLGLIILFSIGLNKWPDFKGTTILSKGETWLIVDTLRQPYIDYEKAKSAVASWLDEQTDKTEVTEAESASTEPTILYLKDGTGGGHIRSEPSMSATTVTKVSPGEPITFLGEQHNDGERTWLKVKTPSDAIGWISANIVQ